MYSISEAKFEKYELLLVRKQRHPRTLNECSISGVIVIYRAAISTKAAPH